MKRRILSIITALALCLGLCPAWAFAAETEAGDSGSNDPYQMEADSVPVPLAEGDESPTDAVAKVVTASGTTYVINLADAFAVENDGAAVTLLADVTPSENIDIASDTSFQLDLNGHTCAFSDCHTFVVEGSLTVSDSKGGGGVTSGSTCFGVNWGGVLTITGGTFYGEEDAVTLGSTDTLQVSGGTLTGDQTIVYSTRSLNLNDILAEGCAASNRFGLLERRTSPSTRGTITVAKCTEGLKPVDNGDGTHTLKCLYCGQTGDTEDCSYGRYIIDANDHTQTCSACGHIKLEAHTFKLTAAADGSTVTVRKECEACGYSEELGKAVFTFENLTYMDPEAKVSWTKTGPELLGVAVKIDDADNYVMQGDVNEISCNLMDPDPYAGTPVKAGAHTLKVLFYDDSSRQDSNECALPFTVAECPHTGLTFAPVGDDTHTGTCPLCGDTITQDCDYGEYEHDDTNHWKTCKVCGYQNVNAHDRRVGTPIVNGNTTTNYKECSTCRHKWDYVDVTITLPDNLTYGGTGGVTPVCTAEPAQEFTYTMWELSTWITSEGQTPVSMEDGKLPADLPAGDYWLYFTGVLADHSALRVEIEFTVSPAPLTADMVALDTASAAYTGQAQEPTVTVNGLTAGTDYTVEYSNNVNAGDATVTVTGKGNYTGEVEKTFSITKAVPNVTAPTASAIEYGQKLSDSTLTGGTAVNPNGGAPVAGSWSWVNQNTRPTADGAFPAAFVPSDTANYSTPGSVDTSVTVNPAAPKITVTVPAYQIAGGTVTVTCKVENPHDAVFTDGIPSAALTYKVGDGAPQTMTGTSFTIPGEAAVGAVVTVTASTAAVDGKYAAASSTADVTVTDKIPVEISGVSVTERAYNGKPVSYTGVPVVKKLDGEIVTDAAVAYTWNTADGAAPINAGDYTLTIAADGGNYIGSTTVDFSIGKANITITADNKRADAGAARPALTYTVSGLADGEKLAAEPILTCDANMDVVGGYPITAGGAAVPNGGNYNTAITYVAGTLTVTEPAVPVTGVTLNKTSTTLTVGGSERLTAAVTPGDAADKTVTWASSNTAVATVDASGTVTAVSAGTAVITVTTADGAKTAACTVTVRTNSSGGGGTTSTPSTPSTSTATVTVPVSGDRSTVRVSANVTGSIATVSRIDTTQIENVIGEDGQASMVEIDFTGLGRNIDTVRLPADAIKNIAAKAQDEEVRGLTVKLPAAEVSFDARALSAIQTQAGSQITLTVTPAKPADLNSRQKEAAGSAPVFDLTLRSSGGAITNLRGGCATVSLPYTLAAGQNPSGVVVYYLDSTGNITPCATMYDVRSKSAIFTTGHFSLYFVGYDPAAVWVNPFSDVAEDAWYYNAVRYASENGLMGGYGSGRFGPNDNLSRAQFAQILFSKEGMPVVNYLLQYGDVAAGAWYAESVRWSTSQGIVGGYGNGMFGPNDNITREQLAVMLWRYAGRPAATDKKLHFTDADKVSGYALEAVRWAVENGVMNGYGDGQFDPKGLATRAQVAQMLKDYLEG